MCTGSGAMPRGVAECGERHETVSSSNAARARARHYKEHCRSGKKRGRFGRAAPGPLLTSRYDAVNYSESAEISKKSQPNTSPTENQVLTNKNQVVTKSLPSSYQL